MIAGYLQIVRHSYRRERTFHTRATTTSERQVQTGVAQRIVIRFLVWEGVKNTEYSAFAESHDAKMPHDVDREPASHQTRFAA